MTTTSHLGFADDKTDSWVYAGTYTGPESKGIYLYRFSSKSGTLTPLGVAAETPSPSFLVNHPNGKYLYAVNELSTENGQPAGTVTGFAVDHATGKLTKLNTVSTHGASPCHLAIDATGGTLMAANYESGSVAVFPILPDGHLLEASQVIHHHGSGPNAKRQEGPHAHEVVLSPDQHRVLVADLGLDKIQLYKLDAKNHTLTPNDPEFTSTDAGAGPRHMVFDHSGKHVFVINEMGGTIAAYSYDPASGKMAQLQSISTLPAGFKGANTTAELQLSKSGKFLYGSNRGDDSLAAFSVDPATAHLTSLGFTPTQGKGPRHFTFDPSGNYILVANQGSNNVVIFKVNAKTGELQGVGEPVHVPSPVDLLFVPMH